MNCGIDSKLQEQLKDAISIATQALPSWCGILTSTCHFLFNPVTRKRYLWCTAFGVSRAVEFLQQGDPQSSTTQLSNELTQLNERVIAMYMTGQDPQRLQAQADQIEDLIRQRRRNHIGVLKHDYVRGVRRAAVLSDARSIIASLSSSRSALQVTFDGETGHGDGVTRGFYVAVAEQLQNRAVNYGMDKLPPQALAVARDGGTLLDAEATRLIRVGDSIVVEEFSAGGAGGPGKGPRGGPGQEEVEEEELEDANPAEPRVEGGASGGSGGGGGLEPMEPDADDEAKAWDGPPPSGIGHPTRRQRLRVESVEMKGTQHDKGRSSGRIEEVVKRLKSHRDHLDSGSKLSNKVLEELRQLDVPGLPSVSGGEDAPSDVVHEAKKRVEERILELEARRWISISPPYKEPTNHCIFWHSPRRGVIQNNLHVVAGPRLQTSEDLTSTLKPGDVVLLRLAAPNEESDSAAGVYAHIPMSSSSPTCSDLDDSSIQTQLAKVTSRLRATRDRKEILSLMRRREELLCKRDNSMAHQESGNPGDMVIDLGGGDGPGAPQLEDGVDDRAHPYSVVHVTASTLTVDRPVHANPDQQLVASWPQEMTFVPDSTETEGFLRNEFGLFPAPLILLDDCKLNNPDALANWYFLGQIMAKALQDGFLVPLPLAPLFFKVVCGEPVDPTLLAAPDSHMRGCGGETVASMMALIPDLRRAASDPKRMDAILRRSYSFTAPEQSLESFLADPSVPIEFSDPVTGVALGGSEPTVHRHNLLAFLEAVADHWLGKGIERQVQAFRRGISQVFDWKALLAFSPRELCSMMCGADAIEWTEKSLRKMLKPASGFTQDSATVDFLRSELIAMKNDQRQKFLKFATAVPRLVPDLTLIVACKGKGGSRLPTAQTCTPQINLPVYRNRRELRAALDEAIAHSEVDGGFHEREAGSDGDTTGTGGDGGGGSGGGGGGGFGFGGGSEDMVEFEDEGSDMEEDEDEHHDAMDQCSQDDDSSHDGGDEDHDEHLVMHDEDEEDEDEDEDEPSRAWELIHHDARRDRDGDGPGGDGGSDGAGIMALGGASSLVDYLF